MGQIAEHAIIHRQVVKRQAELQEEFEKLIMILLDKIPEELKRWGEDLGRTIVEEILEIGRSERFISTDSPFANYLFGAIGKNDIVLKFYALKRAWEGLVEVGIKEGLLENEILIEFKAL